ncbi:FIP2 [Symbiodinium natans]|uniref:FIP2 protein n=1 Tax=Symbiodinium natans TaxID=878477 RepID=A0A812N4G5_9DINO|nr:FIP2 [Symbiodinium natans]
MARHKCWSGFWAGHHGRPIAVCVGLLLCIALGSLRAFVGIQKLQPRRPRVAGHAQRRIVRCPGCGQAQRKDCDGNGRLMGGIAQVFDDSPVKAYRVCPRYKGRYQRRGQKFDTLFDPDVEGKERSSLLEVPATWRSLTKIRLRELPDVASKPTGESLGPYESFQVDDVIRKDGQHFLKLAGKTGWAFDRGVVGAWNGKPICERLG